MYVNLPAGVTTRLTERRMAEIVEHIQAPGKYPELGNSAAYVGFGGPRFVLSLAPLDPAPHTGFIVINADNYASVKRLVPLLREDLRQHFSDLEVRVTGMFLGSSDPNVIHLQVKGHDPAYLQLQAEKLEKLLRDIPGTIDVWSNWYNPVTRLAIQVDQQRARAAGVSSEDIARALSSYTSGLSASLFRTPEEVFSIVIRAVEGQRTEPGRLSQLQVFAGNSRDSVPLGQIASILPVAEYATVHREDLQRTITVEARNLNLSPEDLAPLLEQPMAELNAALKPGYQIEFDGIVTDSKAGKAALFAGFPLCLMMAVILLVAQFNGYRRPIIVMLTIPLVILGVGLGLKVMQASFGFIVILGLFALAGIIVNNAIVLIDRIDIQRNLGQQSDLEAVIQACGLRLRPILITTITTIAGPLPLILSHDVLFYGMASAMAWGLAVGTVLTLGVTPVLYCIFLGIGTEAEALASCEKDG